MNWLRKVEDDGVEANVFCIQKLLKNLQPLVTRSEVGLDQHDQLFNTQTGLQNVRLALAGIG